MTSHAFSKWYNVYSVFSFLKVVKPRQVLVLPAMGCARFWMTPKAARDNNKKKKKKKKKMGMGVKCIFLGALLAQEFPEVHKMGVIHGPFFLNFGEFLNCQKSKIGGYFCKMCTYDPMYPLANPCLKHVFLFFVLFCFQHQLLDCPK